ncbi:MAG TPA: hypothetical protein VMJ10_27790 [Kofleriaceae bacterium]|nr:hypothetical protein [Kofleriaceae bacterium]
MPSDRHDHVALSPYRDGREALRVTGVWRRRNLVAIVLAALPMVVALAVFGWVAARGGREPRWMPLLSYGICVSWLAVPLMWARNAFARERRGELVLDRAGVTLDGQTVIAGEDLEHAEVARRGWPATCFVKLHRRGAWLVDELAASGEGEAARMVEALGFGPDEAPLVFVAPGRLFRLGVATAFSIFAMFGATVAILAAVAASGRGHGGLTPVGQLAGIAVGVAELAGFVALARRTATRVAIGRSGIELRRAGRERSIAWSEVTAIEPWLGVMTRGGRALPAGLDVVLASGERVGIFTANECRRVGVYDRDIVASRIEELRGAR